MFKFIIFILLFILYSCDKNIPDPIDARYKFIGTYIGTHSWDYSDHPDLCTISHGTDSFTITVTYGKTDSTLSVFGTELCKVNDSTYKNCKFGEYSIQINNNRIHAGSGGGGTVCRWSKTYKGVKK